MILEGSGPILSAFQHASACEGCPRAAAGRVEGWATQPSKYWNIYWYGRAPASMVSIYGIFLLILTQVVRWNSSTGLAVSARESHKPREGGPHMDSTWSRDGRRARDRETARTATGTRRKKPKTRAYHNAAYAGEVHGEVL